MSCTYNPNDRTLICKNIDITSIHQISNTPPCKNIIEGFAEEQTYRTFTNKTNNDNGKKVKYNVVTHPCRKNYPQDTDLKNVIKSFRNNICFIEYDATNPYSCPDGTVPAFMKCYKEFPASCPDGFSKWNDNNEWDKNPNVENCFKCSSGYNLNRSTYICDPKSKK
jgi:hypothetical protein